MRTPWSVPAVTISRCRRGGYTVTWTVAGRRRRIHRHTHGQAADLQTRIRAELAAGPQPTEKTWLEASGGFLRDLVARGTSRAAIVDLEATLARFSAIVAPLWVAQFDPEALTRYLRGRQQEVEAPTVAKDWRNLRAFGRWCARRGWLPRCPTELVACPREPHRVKSAPNESEWLDLLEVIGRTPPAKRDPADKTLYVELDDRQAWHLLVLLAVVTGLRRGALLDIRLSDITIGDSESGGVGLLRATSKGRRESVHGLPPIIADRLAQRISALPDGAIMLFPWCRFPRAAWARLRRIAHYNHDFQALRRASATRRAVARATAAASEHLRHSDSSVTERHYLDSAEVQRAVAAALALPVLPPLPKYAPQRLPHSRVARTVRT